MHGERTEPWTVESLYEDFVEAEFSGQGMDLVADQDGLRKDIESISSNVREALDLPDEEF